MYEVRLYATDSPEKPFTMKGHVSFAPAPYRGSISGLKLEVGSLAS